MTTIDVLTLLLALATAALAFFTWRNVVATRAMVNEMKASREEQSRPYIIIDLIAPKLNICDMIIKNAGNGSAFNIRVTFSPDVMYFTKVKLSQLPVFQQMKFFPSGKEIRFFFGSMLDEPIKSMKQFQAGIEYEDSTGKKYLENITLDPHLHRSLAYLTEKDMDDLVKSVDEIADSNKKLEKQLEGILNELKSGIKIDTMDIHTIDLVNNNTLLSKLNEFRNIWNNLHLSNSNHSYEYFKKKFRILSFQIVNFASLSNDLDNNLVQSCLNVAKGIFELSYTQLYMDGGTSQTKFNDHGSSIVEIVDKILKQYPTVGIVDNKIESNQTNKLRETNDIQTNQNKNGNSDKYMEKGN